MKLKPGLGVFYTIHIQPGNGSDLSDSSFGDMTGP